MAWWQVNEQEQFSDWQELRTDDGLVYYFNRATQETTWDKPEELMTEEEKSSAQDFLWVPDDKDVFVAARRLGQQGNQMVVEVLDTNEERYLSPRDETIPLNKSSLQRIVPDLTLLDEMSVPLILHCLRKRFEGGKIYSAVGTILISINPYTNLDLYSPKMIKKYRNSLEEHREVPPHVYVVADQAYKGLTFESGQNQSIVISGESGAGKTEAAKQCLSYLGAVAGSVSNIEKKVFQSNPILEGFGNAKTIRNNNSSRFGKYVEIFFNQHLQLMGGQTQNYLLEKIRVVKQAQNERNYHIFYMLTKAADRNMRQELELSQPESFRICAQGNCTTVPGINDKNDFEELKEAFQTLEFPAPAVQSLFRVLAGILHLGNVEFEVIHDRFKDDTSRITNPNIIQLVARLWGVSAPDLERSVVNKLLVMPGQAPVEVGLDEKAASDQRDALCKYIYDQTFDWLVQGVNRAMETRGRPHKMIGILDIFGFEIFQSNSLEQLCINFCNEKLQQLFNFTVFKQEEKVYQTEAIGFDHVPFIDNQPILDMIETKPRGLLPMLDEEGRTPGGSEPKYRQKLDGAHGSHPNFKQYSRDQQCFVLQHYAGDVIYDTNGFIEKNKDVLDAALLKMLNTANEHLFSLILKKGGKMSAGQRKATLSLQFRNQLNSLMKSLQQTQPHYIRCIKPNDDKEPLYFVPRNCFEQLTYSGVFEAVKIRKAGFPFRLRHSEFVERYQCILEEAGQRCGTGTSGCQDIVRFLGLNQDNTRQGRTMMLYRSGEHKIMELKRSIIMEKRKMNETLRELINTNASTLEEPEFFYERLARAVRSCKRFNIDNDLSRRAKVLLMEYIESRIDDRTKQMVEDALASRDLALLEEVCRVIEENDYQTERCKLCVKMRDRIHRINTESERACITLETEHMEACLYAAQELEYQNEYIEYFQWMFSELGKNSEKFVQEQLRQAVKMQDVKRQIRLSIKLKSVFFEKMSSMFVIQNCPILKEPDDYARQKLLPFGRDQIKLGMMQHATDEIIGALTDIPKGKNAGSKTLFKNLQIYMQDRQDQNTNIEQAGLEVLNAAYADQELRDEVYCQVIKQLTGNSNPTSQNRGWNMLTLALYIFPPSQELENYLEVFIRGGPQDRAEPTLVALHSVLYSNQAARKPPTIQDMQDILKGLRPLRRDFADEAPELPSWSDLLRPFDQADEDDEFGFESSAQPLAGAVGSGIKMASSKPVNMARRHHASVNQPPAAPTMAPPKFQAIAEEKAAKSPAASSGGPPPVPGFSPGAPATAASAGPSGGGKKKWGGGRGGGGVSTGAAPGGGGGGIAALKAKLAAQSGGGGFNAGGGATSASSGGAGAPKKKWGASPAAPAGGGGAAPPSQPRGQPSQAPPSASGPDDYQWLCHLDPESGTVFYENISSGETQWERPSGNIKPHWLAHLEPESGELYFENLDTGETTWDRPDEFSDPDDRWMARKDPTSGEYYYENLENGETTWDVPPPFQEKQPDREWLRHFDPNSGEYYYENLRTGITTWDAPAGVTF